MISIAEHNARVEEMKASEERMRKWLDDPRMHVPWVEEIRKDVRLLLERIGNYEASIAWHTNCLTCPKLFDETVKQHEKIRELEGGIRECQGDGGCRAFKFTVNT